MDDGIDHAEAKMRLATDLACALIAANRLLDTPVSEIMKTCVRAVNEAAAVEESLRLDFSPAAMPVSGPAVPIAKSLSEDFLVCLECGSRFQSLKRHLGAVHRLTPEAYRLRWQLPPDYPMSAPLFSRVRSRVALSTGLGRKRGTDRAVRPDGGQRASATEPAT